MNFTEFLSKNNGKYVEVAGSSDALNQCVDLANLYIRDVLGFPIIEWTNAVDFPSKAGDNYTWIKNTIDNVPQEGDLMIWSISTYGHIAIFIEGNTSTFRSFDQNYPLGTPCHVQNHNYISPKVIGWMRPKSATTTQPTVPEITDQTIIDLGTFGKHEVQAIRGYYAETEPLKKDLENTRQSLSECQYNLEEAEFINQQQLTVIEDTNKQLRDASNALTACEIKSQKTSETPDKPCSCTFTHPLANFLLEMARKIG